MRDLWASSLNECARRSRTQVPLSPTALSAPTLAGPGRAETGEETRGRRRSGRGVRPPPVGASADPLKRINRRMKDLATRDFGARLGKDGLERESGLRRDRGVASVHLPRPPRLLPAPPGSTRRGTWPEPARVHRGFQRHPGRGGRQEVESGRPRAGLLRVDEDPEPLPGPQRQGQADLLRFPEARLPQRAVVQVLALLRGMRWRVTLQPV